MCLSHFIEIESKRPFFSPFLSILSPALHFSPFSLALPFLFGFVALFLFLAPLSTPLD